MGNIAAIVGRPNVGKSTLFNRLTESRDAIVDETSGTTRDRHYGKVDWNGVEFSLIDTGGYVINSDDVFEEEIRDLDDSFASILRKSKKKVFLVANKVDNNERIHDSYEFHKFGLGDIYCVSSITGSGTGELLDAVVKSFVKEPSITMEDLPRITVVGRPNVGKSSLINTLIGEERNIVTPIPGTTRDATFVRYNKFNHDFYLVDTAGLRKKTKVTENIEFYSVMRSIRAIESSDVCLLMLDATQGIESQDLNIFQLCQKNKKGIVILVNKWDLVEKDNHSTIDYTRIIHDRISPFKDVPVIFTSAITKQRVHKVLEIAIEVYNNRKKHIATSKLNEVMLEAISDYHPPAIKGKLIKIKYITQLPTPTPSFVFFANLPQYVKEPYKRYLENKLRENFDFTGVPIQIFLRQK
jgi:GTP-binding protein